MPWVGLRQESDNIWIRTGSCVVLNRRVWEVGNARLARSCRALLSYLPIYPFRSGYQGDFEYPESTCRTSFVMYEQFLNFYRKVCSHRWTLPRGMQPDSWCAYKYRIVAIRPCKYQEENITVAFHIFD